MVSVSLPWLAADFKSSKSGATLAGALKDSLTLAIRI